MQSVTTLPESHRELVDRIQADDRSAEDELVLRLNRRVFVILLARISDAEKARELTQDVLMAVLAAIRERKVQDPDRLPAFVQGVTRNLANNFLRTRSHAPVLVELTEEMAWLDAEEEAEMADRRQWLRSAVAKLDTVDRQILVLSIVEGHSAPEVADLVGLSADAVRARKSRVLKRFAQTIRAVPSHPEPV